MSIENPNAIEHQNVPQAHQGLHDFLYNSDDEHTVDSATVPVSDKVIEAPIPVSAWFEAAGDAKVAGVYAVFDQAGNPQYVNYSRNVSLSLKSHITQQGESTCAQVKVQPFKFPKRAEMEQLCDEWIAEFPEPPPGNSGNGNWTGSVKDAAVQAMSAEERQAYEDKKVKLQKAMALGVTQAASVLPPSEAERRQSLESAITDDNWSEVVREQTQETRPE